MEKKEYVLRQNNNIISSLLNLLKQRADCLIKYIFASGIFYQKSVSHQNYYVMIKSKNIHEEIRVISRVVK